jgi:hypothetical protein
MLPASTLAAPDQASQRAPFTQLLAAYVLLLFFVALLRVWRFPVLYQFVRRWPTRRRIFSSRNAGPEEIISALRRAAVWLPVRPLCLAYSAALVVLLRSHAVAAELVIGVTQRPFGSHAWVESEGRIVGPMSYTKMCVVLDRF